MIEEGQNKNQLYIHTQYITPVVNILYFAHTLLRVRLPILHFALEA
jgi:hypothetical protein